jgi:hypothetical protein
MGLVDWFNRLRQDGAAEVMKRLGVEEPADLLEIEEEDVAEIAAALPKLKAKQFQKFVTQAS